MKKTAIVWLVGLALGLVVTGPVLFRHKPADASADPAKLDHLVRRAAALLGLAVSAERGGRDGLDDILVKRVGKMSTGMKQRLSIARVVFHEPEILIFDEPTSGLDVIGAREVLRLVRELRGKGRTVIFSTHIMTEAERICDEIAIIEKGTLMAQGTPASLGVGANGKSLDDVFVDVVGGGDDDR